MQNSNSAFAAKCFPATAGRIQFENYANEFQAHWITDRLSK